MRQALTNKCINYLNIHFGIQRFAEAISRTFGPIYLYKIGMSIPEVFMVWGGLFVLRFLIRPFMLKLINTIGLKKSVIWGSILYCGQYLVLGMSQGFDIWLYTFMLYFAIVETLYWFSYHTYFTTLGDREKRGQQSGIREALLNIGSILAPILGALFIYHFSFWSIFLLSFVLFVLSIIPLFYTKEVEIKNGLNFQQAWKEIDKQGMMIYLFAGFTKHAFDFTWIIVLFLLLNEFIEFGLILGIAILLKTIIFYGVGQRIDMKKDTHWYLIYGLILSIIAIIGKVYWGYTIVFIIALDALYMLASSLNSPYINTIVYNNSHDSKSPLWYQFFSETGWDIGIITSSFFILLMLYNDIDLRYTMLLSIVSLFLLTFALSPVYKTYKLSSTSCLRK